MLPSKGTPGGCGIWVVIMSAAKLVWEIEISVEKTMGLRRQKGEAGGVVACT